MTRLRRLVCLWTLASVVCAIPARAADGEPRVAIDEPVYDFGTVEQGEAVEMVFRVRNAGSAPLRVDHVKGTCACTVGLTSGEAVAPGDATSVVVRLDTARLAGRTTKTVTIYTNDPVAPTVGVTLTGQVLTDLVVTPTPLYLGRIRQGMVVRRTLTVVAGRPGAPAYLTGVEATNPHVRARIEPSPDGQGQQVVVEVDAAMPPGRFNDELVLRTTSGRQPTLRVRVLGTIEGGVARAPSIAPGA